MCSTLCRILVSLSQSNLQCGLLLNKSFDGDTPVVDCGVIQYAKSILVNQELIVPSFLYYLYNIFSKPVAGRVLGC